MKFALVTYGTEGDVRPLATLAAGLMASGHEVCLLADGGTLNSARVLGVPCLPLAGDIRQALMPGQILSSAVQEKGGFQQTTKALAAIANANTASWMQTVLDASEACDAIIVSGLAAFVGLSVAERRGIKAIGTGLIPITPTADFPSPFLPPTKVPRFLNKRSHEWVNALLWRAFKRVTNQARQQICGLPAQSKVWSDHPMLYGVSPSLLPPPRDWPNNARLCGQWIMPSEAWTMDAELEAFLAAGEAPIYIGFGSMAGFDRARFVDMMIEAMQGRRVVFSPGWSGMQEAILPDNFFKVGEVPHQHLFPHMSAVIHHGGSGTTHSAARAGAPSIVLPFAGDQFFWAHRLALLGVAPEPLSGKRVNSAQLKAALAFVQQDDVRARAQHIARDMEQEEGVAVAVAAIETLMC